MQGAGKTRLSRQGVHRQTMQCWQTEPYRKYCRIILTSFLRLSPNSWFITRSSRVRGRYCKKHRGLSVSDNALPISKDKTPACTQDTLSIHSIPAACEEGEKMSLSQHSAMPILGHLATHEKGCETGLSTTYRLEDQSATWGCRTMAWTSTVFCMLGMSCMLCQHAHRQEPVFQALSSRGNLDRIV